MLLSLLVLLSGIVVSPSLGGTCKLHQYVPGWFRILGHTKSYSYFHGVLCDYHYVLEPFYCFTFKSKVGVLVFLAFLFCSSGGSPYIFNICIPADVQQRAGNSKLSLIFDWDRRSTG